MSIFVDASTKLERHERLRIAILGASGSIGTQALDVARQHADRVEVTALAVANSVDALVKAAVEFNVKHVAIANEAHKNDAVLAQLPEGTEVGFGDDAVTALAQLPDVDCVIVALVGYAGIWSSKAALEAGKIWAPANKEALVCAGDLLMPMAKPGCVLPIDSEHNAIYQCLVGERRSDVRHIWLTCSGGPFFGKTRDELSGVTAADALAHPTWNMGPKITIDCATLMNKGLEVIEAMHLFGVPVDSINVLIHRQSKIHSAVEFADDSVKAQLGPSDMRIPIQYALSFPERWEAPAEPIDWRTCGELSFAAPDEKTFKCLSLAKAAGNTRGNIPCILNGANEVVNEAFRKDLCSFNDIGDILEQVVSNATYEPLSDFEQIKDADAWARTEAKRLLTERA